jgi:hypothetical protein
MKTPHRLIPLLGLSSTIFSLLLLIPGSVHAGSFSSDFNSGAPAGATSYGNALVDTSGGVGDTGVLKLTPAAVSQQGSFIIDDLDPGQRISSFLATFRVRMGGGSPSPGDGMSFNFATDLPNSDFNEDGAGSGLTITFDTFENGPPWDNSEGPEIRLRSGGTVIDRRKISNQFRTDVNFVDVSVSYTSSGTLTLVYNGIVMYTNFFVFGPLVSGARFGFSARCGGGADETHYVDDLNITTTPVSRFYVKGAVTPSPASEVSAATPFQVALQDSGATVDTNSVSMSFNGASVVPSVSKNTGSGVTTISFQPLLPLPASSLNHVKVSFGYSNDASIDALNYDFTVAHAPLWGLATGDRSYLLPDLDLANGSTPLWRSIAYNPFSNHIYVVCRTNTTSLSPNQSGLNIRVLDAKTGADLWQLNTNGIPGNNRDGGIFPLMNITVADDGRIYACNVSNNDTVIIYAWADGNASTVPQVVFHGVASTAGAANLRWGDALAARGAGAGTQLVLDGGGTFTDAAILTATDAFATNFTSTGYTHTYPSGDAIGRSIQFGPTNTYFIKRRSTAAPPPSTRSLQLNRFDAAPNTTALLSVPDFYPQVGPVAVDLSKNLAAGILFVTNVAIPDRLIVYDISNLSSPLQIAQYNFPTNHQKNSNFLGEVVFGSNSIFAVDCNNGIIAVPAFPTFQPGLAITRSNNKVILSWLPSVPEFVLQSTLSLSPASWANVALPVTLTGGKNFVTNTIDSTAKFYRLSPP